MHCALCMGHGNWPSDNILILEYVEKEQLCMNICMSMSSASANIIMIEFE